MSDMYYGASPAIFKTAALLRSSLTKAEKIMWSVLSKNQRKGFRFKSQHPISSFIVDFYCHKARLVIEVDGGIHNTTEQADYDKGRTFELERLGLKVIRFSNEKVENDLERVIKEIETYLVSSPL